MSKEHVDDPVSVELARRLTQAVAQGRKVDVDGGRAYIAGSGIEVKAEVEAVIRDLYCDQPDEEKDDAFDLWATRLEEAPITLLTFDWFDAGGNSLDLFLLPGELTFVTVPYAPTEIPMLVVGALPSPCSARDLAAVIHLLIERNWALFEDLPDRMTNGRPDLLTRQAIRSFLNRISDGEWRGQRLMSQVVTEPRTKKELIDAYMERCYVESPD